MRKIEVALDTRSYPILVGSGLLSKTGMFLSEAGFTDKAVVVTDTIVGSLYGQIVQDSLTGAGFGVTTVTLPVGEEQKSLDNASLLYERMNSTGVERNTPVLALGGGVIGDLTGFAAATYLRGVPLIQIPTTLLAQVDSSIGGKTAVNLETMKNMVGAFYQPRMVISDVSVLKTLPERELVGALAEVLKYGVIADRSLFEYVTGNIARIKECEEEILAEVVFRCASIKARVVEQDEKEKGLRAILNFGHTLGHGVEAVTGFMVNHGEAVALGMLAAGRIARARKMLSDDDLVILEQGIIRSGLPHRLPELETDRLLDMMHHDKKVSGGKLVFVLPESIGSVAVVNDVEEAVIREVVTRFNEKA